MKTFQLVSIKEKIILLIGLVVFFSFNYVTGSQYPIVWIDEVMFTDPAINLYLGNGFHTTVWPYQDESRFFASYPPLYSLVLSAWLQVSTINPIGVRSLNYLLVILASVIIWATVIRLHWIAHWKHRLILVTLIIMGFSIAIGYRSGRPDTLMILLTAAMLFSYTIQNINIRYTLLFAFALLVPFAGLQLGLYVGLTLVIAQFYIRKKFLKEFYIVIAGMLLGLFALLSLYISTDVLNDFLSAMRGGSSPGFFNGLIHGQFIHNNTLPKDVSFIILFPAAVMLFLVLRKSEYNTNRHILSYSFFTCFVIPLAFIILGKFPTYYSWMIYVPLSIAIMSSMGELQKKYRQITFVFVAGACLTGLPLMLIASSYSWEDRSHETIVTVINKYITNKDRVITQYGAYYAVKNQTSYVYGPHYVRPFLVNKKEKESITVIVGSDRFSQKTQKIIGGQWELIEEIKPKKDFLTENKLRIPLRFGMINKKYNLKIYRRQDIN